MTETTDAVSYTRSAAIQATGVPGVTLDEAIRAKELPAIKSGRRLIILKEDLLAWLRRCRERGNIPPAPVQHEDYERLARLNRDRKAKRKAEAGA